MTTSPSDLAPSRLDRRSASTYLGNKGHLESSQKRHSEIQPLPRLNSQPRCKSRIISMPNLRTSAVHPHTRPRPLTSSNMGLMTLRSSHPTDLRVARRHRITTSMRRPATSHIPTSRNRGTLDTHHRTWTHSHHLLLLLMAMDTAMPLSKGSTHLHHRVTPGTSKSHPAIHRAHHPRANMARRQAT